jgi:TonB family protein
MRRHLRDLTLHALAVAALLIAPHSILAAPPSNETRTVISRISPVYPELARRMRVTGIVLIRAVVLPNGKVAETYIESGHPLLRAAAEDAVRRWRFAANPDSSDCIVSVGFELPQ